MAYDAGYRRGDESVFSGNDINGGGLFIPLLSGPSGGAACVSEEVMRKTLPSGPLDLSQGVVYRICVYAPPEENMPQCEAQLMTELLCVDTLGDVVDDDYYDDMCYMCDIDVDEPNDWVEFGRISSSDVDNAMVQPGDVRIDYGATRTGGSMCDDRTPDLRFRKPLNNSHAAEEIGACSPTIGKVVVVGTDMPQCAEMIGEVHRLDEVSDDVPRFAEVIDEDSNVLTRAFTEEGRQTLYGVDDVVDGRMDALGRHTIPTNEADDATLPRTTAGCESDQPDTRKSELEEHAIPASEADETSLRFTTPACKDAQADARTVWLDGHADTDHASLPDMPVNCHDDLSDGRTAEVRRQTIPPSDRDDTSVPCRTSHCYDDLSDERTADLDRNTILLSEADDTPLSCTTPGCDNGLTRTKTRELEGHTIPTSEADEISLPSATPDGDDDQTRARRSEFEETITPTSEADETSLPSTTPGCEGDQASASRSEHDEASLPSTTPSCEGDQAGDGTARLDRHAESDEDAKTASTADIADDGLAAITADMCDDDVAAKTAGMGDDGARLVADGDQLAECLTAQDGARQAKSENSDEDALHDKPSSAPAFVRSGEGRGPSRVTVVESQINHLGEQLQFIKDALGSLVANGRTESAVAGSAEMELASATEETPIRDQVIGCCQTDDSLLEAFLREHPDFLPNGMQHSATQTEVVRSQRRKSTARSVAFSVLSDDADSDTGTSKNGASEDLVGEILKERFSVKARRTGDEDFDTEIRMYDDCFQECEEWIANVQFFSLPVRHLGPEGGSEQENLFGARVRSNSLLRHSRTMDQWKSWATQYLMTTGRELECDDRMRCSVLSESGRDCREEAFGLQRRTTGARLDLASLSRVGGDGSAWVAVWSAEYQRCYYWNEATDEVTWVQPVTEE